VVPGGVLIREYHANRSNYVVCVLEAWVVEVVPKGALPVAVVARAVFLQKGLHTDWQDELLAVSWASLARQVAVCGMVV